MILEKQSEITPNKNVISLLQDVSQLAQTILSPDEQEYVKKTFHPHHRNVFSFNRLTHYLYLQVCSSKSGYQQREDMRKMGDKAAGFFQKENQSSSCLQFIGTDKSLVLAFAEGCALGAYRFSKHKKAKSGRVLFEKLFIVTDTVSVPELKQLKNLVTAVYATRDMVNEPVNVLDTRVFSQHMAALCTEAGAQVKVFDKQEITELGMEALLTVNKGSLSDPAFITIEWKPKDAVNEKPLVLVGKGLVFDTGGINLKPGSGLNAMKSDMAGGAAVFGCMYALALNHIPVHVISLVPATDNRPGQNAMVPGDIIKMKNGKTIEIINTDAEGRLILADALLYAQRYNPMLVIDIATLTGAASIALGRFGIAAVQQHAEDYLQRLKESSMQVYERIAELPFWEEYGEEIVSDIADLRNISKTRGGGTITAAKFLSHFVDYPWIHLDIAPVAFMDTRESYMGKGATAAGVRLLYDFITQKITQENTVR